MSEEVKSKTSKTSSSIKMTSDKDLPKFIEETKSNNSSGGFTKLKYQSKKSQNKLFESKPKGKIQSEIITK
tara:strand:- start:317 stop:529 length:213 start_codon:yes stop_codon:yes gene_type:complete